MNDNSERVLAARYYKKDKDGKVTESRQQLFMRVATHVASVEKDKTEWAQDFFELMDNGYFLPNTPCLANAGRKDGQLSACYVIGVDDSLESIFDSISLSAKIFQTGGGVGISFNELRPEGASIGDDNNKVSSGPISFIKLFDEMANSVKQGGIRRGAFMGSLSVHHPSISEFIDIKKCSMDMAERLRELGVDNTTIQELMVAVGFTNFNLSIQVTDKFMRAVTNNENYETKHPEWNNGESNSINAGKIWNSIAKNAHDSGCPGILFVDRINKDNLLYPKKVIETSNPCGETPLLPGEQCCLGSIDLSKFVCNTTDGGIDFNYILFSRVIPKCIRFLDDVIDVNNYPTKKIETAAKYTRKIGLGVMGYADTLIKLGLEYGSEKALEFTEKLAECFRYKSSETSRELGMEKGMADAYMDCKSSENHRRNMMVNVIAPTGSLSMIANCSPGIEPIYDIHYTKNVSIGSFSYEHPDAKKYFDDRGWDWNGYKDAGAYMYLGSDEGLDMEDVKGFWKLFSKADEISYDKHIKTQATWQKYIDGSISKTVALPADATPDTFKKAYMLAYELGCKGITAFKSCPVKQGVYSRSEDETKDNEPSNEKDIIKRKRPQRVQGFTEVIPTSQGKMYVTVNSDDAGLSEVFVSIGRSGYESTSKTEAIGRLISLCLRSNIPLENIIKQLSGISCDRPVHSSHGLVRSVPDGVAKILSTLLNSETEIKKYEDSEQTCPNCFLPLEIPPGGGCPICQRCGKQCNM